MEKATFLGEIPVDKKWTKSNINGGIVVRARMFPKGPPKFLVRKCQLGNVPWLLIIKPPIKPRTIPNT